MPISEPERKVLEQLEQQFRPASSSRAGTRWSGISRTKRCGAAAVALPVELALVILGLILNSAFGLILALVGFVLIVVSVWVIAECTPGVRVTFVRGPQPRSTAQPPRFSP